MTIRKFRLTISPFIKQWLAPHLRLPGRQSFFELLLTSINTINSEYMIWRNKAITKANVTNEKISLEWYLNKLFDPTLQRIYIQTRKPVGIGFGLSATEPLKFQGLGLSGTEPTEYIGFPLEDEDPDVGQYDFGIFVPAALTAQQDDIMNIALQFAKANKSFTTFLF
ncbi:MAG: hypothetical protein ACK4EY_15065 [Flavipsychrobacter sp.]